MAFSRRLLCLTAFLLGLTAVLPPATAQTYPNRPVRLIVPFAAGGSTDVAARLIASHLTRSLGQQFIVENRPGASGTIGLELAAKSAPDGLTLLVGTDSVASSPHLFKMGIDPMKDLVPVVQLSRQPVALAVHPSLGVASLTELIAMAKKRPGMSYASSGIGSQQHMVGEWLAKLTGVKLEHVPYRGGGQAINDLVAGHLQIAFLGSSPLIPHHKAGTVRLLAQSTATRSSSLPDVPTYEEAGIKGLVLDQWIGIFVPAGTPPAIVTLLNTEINKALSDPAARASFLTLAQEPVGGTSDAFVRLLHEDFAKYERLVRDLNIKAQ